ncbi:hypothetical protein ACFYU9_24810 [Streptomyces sp. NPDC004327]|uniref:hypothetical protein n=1 Tax=unclassified Streptomyces TaxID=2593676 RepID=UPI0036C65092
MSWTREGFESHAGAVGVLLADGSEPGPVYFDLGSGAHFHESTDWWAYDGTFHRPTATTMRGRCACGWRGERTFPIDWQQIDPDDLYSYESYDTSGPEADWEAHLDDVVSRATPLPEDVSGLLSTLRERLDDILDDTPLTVLKAADELESIVAFFGPLAARFVSRGEETSLPAIAEALGMTEKAARSRLHHYAYMRF